MKIKFLNGILVVDLLTVLLLLSIIFIPSSIIRIILGIPFILFFPGYTLLTALGVHKEGQDLIELVALSAGTSVAVTALIGFGLNYTAWGISLEPVLLCLSSFIFLMSVVSLVRRDLQIDRPFLTSEVNLRLSGNGNTRLNAIFPVFMVVIMLAAIIGFASYMSTAPPREKFTEFYILGPAGKAQDYPAEFIIDQGKVTAVRYGENPDFTPAEWGRVILGIVNQEQRSTVYTVKMRIDGQEADFIYEGSPVDKIEGIALKQGEKWEHELGIVPQHTGESQKVEIYLFKDYSATVDYSLHLWIAVLEKASAPPP